MNKNMNVRSMDTPQTPKLDASMFQLDAPLKFSEVFGTDTLIEKFDRKKLKYILLNWDEYENKCIEYDNEDENNYNPKQILEKYLDKSKGGDSVEVKYKKSDNSKKYGRWFAEGSLSIQNMPRRVRHTICKGLWIDIDFKNCHPVLLEQLCIAYDIDCPYLHKYNTQRDELLHEIMQVSQCDRDEAKRMVLKALNGGKGTVNVEWWSNMRTEFKTIANLIASRKEFDKLKKIVTKYKKDNIEASTMNAVLCYFENKCLEVLYKFFADKKIIKNQVCCLIFDGMQGEDNDYNRKMLTDSLLTDASRFIFDKTGFNLDITIKDFDQALELPEGFEGTFDDTFVIEAGDDKSASDYVIKKYKHLLKKCAGNRIFINNNGIWTDNEKQLNNKLVNLISNLDIRKEGKCNTSVYSRNRTSTENCIKFILADDSYTDDNFMEKLFNSNIGYIAFNNGIWSFAEKKLYAYNDLPHVYFAKKVNRDFITSDKTYIIDGVKRDLNFCKQLVYDRIIDPILPDKVQRDYFLMCLARGLAGHYADKKWYVGQGSRDCGKGVLTLMLELAFQSFIGLFKADNFICHRMHSGDEAKKMSWLIPLEFCRLALSSEINASKDTKLNGVLIKTLASGGDTQQARQNRKDEIDFKLQSTLFMFCNELPEIDPIDTKENLEGFIFKSKFISKADMDELGDNKPAFFKLRDDNIKKWCSNDYVIDAFTSIIFDYYNKTRVQTPKELIDDNVACKGTSDNKSLEMLVNELYQYSPDEADKIKMDDVMTKLVSKGVKNITSNKVRTLFSSLQLGVYDRYRFGSNDRKYGFKFVKLRPRDNTDDDSDTGDDE